MDPPFAGILGALWEPQFPGKGSSGVVRLWLGCCSPCSRSFREAMCWRMCPVPLHLLQNGFGVWMPWAFSFLAAFCLFLRKPETG